MGPGGLCPKRKRRDNHWCPKKYGTYFPHCVDGSKSNANHGFQCTRISLIKKRGRVPHRFAIQTANSNFTHMPIRFGESLCTYLPRSQALLQTTPVRLPDYFNKQSAHHARTVFFSIKTKITVSWCLSQTAFADQNVPHNFKWVDHPRTKAPFPPPLHHLSVPQEPSLHVDRRLRGDNMSRGNMSRGYSPLLSWATAKSQGVVEVSNDPKNCRLD